jgi:steroid delta-isomerase-like uncharacterized protein
MSATATESLGRLFFAEQDRLRGGPAEELCGADYTAQIGSYAPMSLAEHQQFAALFYAAFPDIKHVVEDVVATEEKAAVRFSLHGTQTGAFMGIPATGKSVAVSAIAILQVRNGKVTTLHGVFDQIGLMQQLGALAG